MLTGEMLKLNYAAFVILLGCDILDVRETKRLVDNLDEGELREARSNPVGILHNYLWQRVKRSPPREPEYGTIDYGLELALA